MALHTGWEYKVSTHMYFQAEVARYALTELEQDALNHYPKRPRDRLIIAFRGAMMVFHTLAHELWRRGLRVRILPDGTAVRSVSGCEHLDEEERRDVPGWYLTQRKLIVIREEQLLYSSSVNQKYAVWIHEIAHAVWFLMLSDVTKGEVYELYQRELARRGKSGEYRMKDVFEFWADSFKYYVTPYRRGEILRVHNGRSAWDVPFQVVTRENTAASKATLEEVNPGMVALLDRTFKGVVDPELMMSKPLSASEERRWQQWGGDGGLYLPVEYWADNCEVANW